MPVKLMFIRLRSIATVGICALVAVGNGFAAESPPASRVLVDFRDQQAVNLRPAQAKAEVVRTEAGPALDIKTEADADYPGVYIEPRDGKWDLSGYDGVEMDVRNPQDVSVRVLLSVDNPGADGRNHCNVESATAPPHGKATVVVPFGMWHGNPGHTLDRKNVVSFEVLLDRPGRPHHFFVDRIRAVSFDATSQQYESDPIFAKLKPVFGRGVNLGNALDAPNEGEWGVTLKESYFEAIQAAGFDSVRIPVKWSNHAERTPPYRIDAAFAKRVDWAIGQALQRGLQAIVNIHHYDEIMKEPDAHRERFLALWRQIAERYRDRPPELAFELLNEPTGKLTAEKWNALAAEAIGVIRPTNPTRQIVVGPVGFNSIKDLPLLELPADDRNLVVTVHYYSPFQFTHQGAEWTGKQSQAWLGTKWTATKDEQNAIRRDLNAAIAYGVKHRRAVYLGEFGAYSKADIESRARWTRFVAEEALKRKIGFAYWEFCSGFGVYDPQREAWIEPLKQALLAP